MASGSAVVVRVVQQQNVALVYMQRHLRRDPPGVAWRVQSRPQRDHSIGVQPRARTAAKAGQE